MAFISLPGIPCWGNPDSQRVCPAPIFLRLIQRDVPVTSRFLGRPRLLTRLSSCAWCRDVASIHNVSSTHSKQRLMRGLVAARARG
jgi:hypothetical protein